MQNYLFRLRFFLQMTAIQTDKPSFSKLGMIIRLRQYDMLGFITAKRTQKAVFLIHCHPLTSTSHSKPMYFYVSISDSMIIELFDFCRYSFNSSKGVKA